VRPLPLPLRARAGRLYQVEYAIAAIQNAAAAVGIQSAGGIVVATEKRAASKLLAPPKTSEKVYKLDEHVFTAVAGLTADANILISYARLSAQRHRYTYDEPQPVEQLVQLLCDYKHGYTQSGGLRPFGVSFLYAGWDRHHGYQLYQSDPSGNYSGWKATAIGANAQSAMGTLKTEFKEGGSLADATRLALKVLTKAMDTTSPSADKVELAVLARDEAAGAVTQRTLTDAEVEALLKEIAAASATSADA